MVVHIDRTDTFELENNNSTHSLAEQHQQPQEQQQQEEISETIFNSDQIDQFSLRLLISGLHCDQTLLREKEKKKTVKR